MVLAAPIAGDDQQPFNLAGEDIGEASSLDLAKKLVLDMTERKYSQANRAFIRTLNRRRMVKSLNRAGSSPS
jgi:hypothetical protein